MNASLDCDYEIQGFALRILTVRSCDYAEFN